jgi:hypothetical protein
MTDLGRKVNYRNRATALLYRFPRVIDRQIAYYPT